MSTITTQLPNPRDLDVTTAKLEDLVETLRPWFAKARDAEVEDAPDDETVEEIVRGLFTDHGGRLRPRRSVAKSATDLQRAAFGLLRWHRSGGDLTGLFIAKSTAGARWGEVETTVEVLRVAFGLGSSAIAAWQRTGLV